MTALLERLQDDFAAALVDARAAAAIVPALVARDARLVNVLRFIGAISSPRGRRRWQMLIRSCVAS